ncbi:hypothetical protein LCGC14_2032140 [marine sediment metagenome]|uniref:Uncharacterized protein n=1 Tax=marine sediment metagenome TaxID=412755 RepID=A0A0F9EUJ5_9ZZZZ
MDRFWSMEARCLVFTLFLCVSCASNIPVEPEIGQPFCDDPIAVDGQIWNDLGLLREVISFNSLIDGECIEKLRKRISLHDDAL